MVRVTKAKAVDRESAPTHQIHILKTATTIETAVDIIETAETRVGTRKQQTDLQCVIAKIIIIGVRMVNIGHLNIMLIMIIPVVLHRLILYSRDKSNDITGSEGTESTATNEADTTSTTTTTKPVIANENRSD